MSRKKAKEEDPLTAQINKERERDARVIIDVFKVTGEGGKWYCRLHEHEEIVNNKKGSSEAARFFYPDPSRIPNALQWQVVAGHAQGCRKCADFGAWHDRGTFVQGLAIMARGDFVQHIKHLAEVIEHAFTWPECVRLPYRTTEAYWKVFEKSAYDADNLTHLCHPDITTCMEELYTRECTVAQKVPFAQLSNSLAVYLRFCRRCRFQRRAGGSYIYVPELYFVLLSHLTRELHIFNNNNSDGFSSSWRHCLDKILSSLLYRNPEVLLGVSDIRNIVRKLGEILKPGAWFSATHPEYDVASGGAKTIVNWTSHPTLYASGLKQSSRDLREELGACTFAIMVQACRLSNLPVVDVVAGSVPPSAGLSARAPSYGTSMQTSPAHNQPFTIGWTVILRGGDDLRTALADCSGSRQASVRSTAHIDATSSQSQIPVASVEDTTSGHEMSPLHVFNGGAEAFNTSEFGQLFSWDACTNYYSHFPDFTDRFYAVRRIETGEEIQISHFGTLDGRRDRQAGLWHTWRFDCSYLACSLPGAESKASDANTGLIKQVMDHLKSTPFDRIPDKKLLEAIKAAEREGLVAHRASLLHAAAGSVMFFAKNVEDMKQSLEWMNMAEQTYAVVKGRDGNMTRQCAEQAMLLSQWIPSGMWKDVVKQGRALAAAKRQMAF